MNRPIEQAIENLIPRYSNSIPSVLIELANSIFVQSRSKCTLRAEEEVARAYACANLACERLKGKLDLPPIEPRPPIPPRAYDKLYAYLSSKLDPKTPSKKRKNPLPSTPTTQIRATPSKSVQSRSMLRDKPLDRAKIPGKRTIEDDCNYSHEAKMKALIPLWVLPTIRSLCKQMHTPKATPHILAGVESILCLPKPEITRSYSIDESKLKLPAMIAAVWNLVVSRMNGREERLPDKTEEIKLVLKFLEQARENEMLLKKLDNKEDSWRGWEIITESDVNAWRKEISVGGWKELDWWRNITENARYGSAEIGDNDHQHNLSDEDEDENSLIDKRNPKKVRSFDRYDYLNEERKQEFTNWMSHMLLQINKMIAIEK
ncbi:hypothetical protein EPUL_004692 [Erysiphe pulchra]|uniref:ORC6 first cyclin-like domain-containing protein n=1 Tax=Erysiphe pulchra TaxID=225359 RepID=A0A2S4PMF0_9PEZI|nr:hypothetical protein EPUL_004692 [Erysiphe pulchra]